MSGRLGNALLAERRRREWSQSRMADQAGITRQSYAAIESGDSVPSTEVALRLAQGLGRTVEELFHLPGGPRKTREAVWTGGRVPVSGQPVRLSRVGGRELAHPVGDRGRPATAADGIVASTAANEDGVTVDVQLLDARPLEPDLVVVGCDPAFGVLAEMLRRERGLEVLWTARGSRAALTDLANGRAHIAGTHLLDREVGEWNGPWVRQLVPFPSTRVGFAVWDQGLVARPGGRDPTGISDLGRPGIRIINREAGSGSRMLLDEELAAAGLDPHSLAGYDTAAVGHGAVAEVVSAGSADAGIATRAIATANGLDFRLLRQELYELVVPDHFLDLPSVQALLDVLRRPVVRRQVEALGGYDGSVMGRSARGPAVEAS